MKEKLFAAVAAVLILGVCFVGGLYYLENYDEFYYARVNSSRMKELSDKEGMRYEYTLDCYNENGKKRELEFKTSRELQDGAYISLEVRSMGVHKWEEIAYSDLPQKAQIKIK